MVDSIILHDHAIIVALGIAADGKKHVLALREGATENTAVAKALVEDLVERGLSTERPILWVIDGSKALRRAIRDVFGSLALVQRCQVHKQRNVLENLPENVRPRVRRVLAAAWEMTDAGIAERRLRGLAGSLEREHPGAASSLLEGLTETLTGQRLGVPGALYRTLRSTNAIENLNGGAARFTRNVKHWQGVRCCCGGSVQTSSTALSASGAYAVTPRCAFSSLHSIVTSSTATLTVKRRPRRNPELGNALLRRPENQ